MRVYDISMLVHEGMTVYKNKAEKKPKVEVVQDFKKSSAYESRITMDLHTGTHIDAPLHMLEGGATIETIGLEKLIVPCRVVDLCHVRECIRQADLVSLEIQAGEFLVFKTQNSFEEAFNPEFIYLEKGAAQFLKDCGVAGVGIDALGIERNQKTHATHRTLMNAEIVIIEGLRLKEVPPGAYLLVALPLKLTGVEAAPARAILVESEEFLKK